MYIYITYYIYHRISDTGIWITVSEFSLLKRNCPHQFETMTTNFQSNTNQHQLNRSAFLIKTVSFIIYRSS